MTDNSEELEQCEAQQLNLFAIKKFDKVSEGTKALIYLLWKQPKKLNR